MNGKAQNMNWLAIATSLALYMLARMLGGEWFLWVVISFFVVLVVGYIGLTIWRFFGPPPKR